MIIKVMTRKEASFRQLIAYVAKDAADDRYVLTHNLLDTDRSAIAAEFEANAKLLRKHANGTVIFHDILSITRSRSLGLERQKEILKEVARDYIARRAPDHLVFAGLHEDRAKHLHYHFVISANPLGEWKRAHLSKPELRKLQTEMEARVMSRYPELEQKAAMSHKASGPKISQPGQELLRRGGKVSERQRVSNALRIVLASAKTREELFAGLADRNLELYRRGKTVSVRDLETSRNHRLATLGLADAFKSMSTRIEAGLVPAPSQAITAQPAAAQAPPQIIPQPFSSVRSTTPQENSVDLFQMAFHLVDALSLAGDKGKPLEAEQSRVKTAVAKATAAPQPETSSQHSAPAVQAATQNVLPKLIPAQQPVPKQNAEPLTEAERIAQERLDDIAREREALDRQIDNETAHRMKR